MSYPYGPPDYPPPGYQAYPQSGYPAYGYGYPQPGYPMPRASGAAAITAGLLAVLLCLIAVFGIITTVSLAGTLDEDDVGVALYAVSGIEGLIAFLWLLGGILLMNRKNAGRIILITLSSIGLLGGLAGTVAGLASAVPATSVPGIIGVLLALLMLTLTLVGSTKRWCEEGRQAQYPPAYAQPPYPYY